jgi:peptidoglycan/xylan/chitin deacetylase (PgdA/CDA1 family)
LVDALSEPVRVAFQAQFSHQNVLRELLSPWDVSFTDLAQADVVITYGLEVKCDKKSIVIPDGSLDFRNWIKKNSLQLTSSRLKMIQIDVSERTSLVSWPQESYEFKPFQFSGNEELFQTGFLLSDELLLLKIDIVKEFTRIVDSTLFRKPSRLYSLLTGLPIRYDIAPKSVRNFVLGNHKDKREINYCEKLPLDTLRFVLAKTIEMFLKKKISRRKWKGASTCCLLTHDIDTERGLNRANSVRKLEEKYNLQSAWYIPTKHYPLNCSIVQELADHGEVGVHGAKHAGNLVRLSGQRLSSQMLKAKHRLEEMSKHKISGFRSPLLQHNSVLLEQLKKVGYAYDTSIPTWEPRHPQTMSAFGIGTVFPLHLCGLTEIPVSIIQDHQLLYVLGLKPSETLSQWLSFMNLVEDIGGCSVLLSHPEYGLFDPENLCLYEEFLNAATADKECWFTTPRNILECLDISSIAK